MVLIQLSTFTQLETADLVKTVVCLNLVLSSTLFCLLIRFQFAKETLTLFKKQERLLTLKEIQVKETGVSELKLRDHFRINND